MGISPFDHDLIKNQGIQVKVSDLSDALSLPRPGVTRTVKDMEARV